MRRSGEELDIDSQPRNPTILTTTEGYKETEQPLLCGNLLRHLRLHIGGSLDEILHHLITLLLASSLDLLEFRLGLLICVVLCLLEAARVLISRVSISPRSEYAARRKDSHTEHWSHLSLELLVFVLLLLAVLFNLLLSL